MPAVGDVKPVAGRVRTDMRQDVRALPIGRKRGYHGAVAQRCVFEIQHDDGARQFAGEIGRARVARVKQHMPRTGTRRRGERGMRRCKRTPVRVERERQHFVGSQIRDVQHSVVQAEADPVRVRRSLAFEIGPTADVGVNDGRCDRQAIGWIEPEQRGAAGLVMGDGQPGLRGIERDVAGCAAAGRDLADTDPSRVGPTVAAKCALLAFVDEVMEIEPGRVCAERGVERLGIRGADPQCAAFFGQGIEAGPTTAGIGADPERGGRGSGAGHDSASSGELRRRRTRSMAKHGVSVGG